MEDQPNKSAQQPTTIGGDINQGIKNDTNTNIKPNDVVATQPPTQPQQPITSPTATSLPPQPSTTNTTIYQQPPQKTRIIERPPINPYLKISIIRTTNDSVSCIDPNRPGKIKMIFIDQLKADSIDNKMSSSNGDSKPSFPGGSHPQSQQEVSPRKENMIDGLARLHSSLPSTTTTTTTNSNTTSKNKKEIPVPTITTSSTYNKEIPPTYNIPTSYIRYISPSYNEIVNEVEYNLNSKDEKWLYENLDFGPNAKAKIIMPNGGGSCENGGKNEGPIANTSSLAAADTVATLMGNTTTTKAAVPIKKEKKKKKTTKKKKRGPGRPRKIIQKSSSNINEEEATSQSSDPMDIETTDSDVSITMAPPPPPSSSVAAAVEAAPHSPQRSTTTNQLTLQQVLLTNPKYLHSRYSTRQLLTKYNPKLPLPMFEQMLDVFEKATGLGFPILLEDAKVEVVARIPQLIQIFGPLYERERKMIEEDDEVYLKRWIDIDSDGVVGSGSTDVKQTNDGESPTNKQGGGNEQSSTTTQPPSKQQYPTIAPPITLSQVITQVYNYWIHKRDIILKKPLLRRYQTPTSASDPDPKKVFRQRDKESKRRLRKKKQNDIEAYNKMKMLKHDFEQVKVLCDLIIQREQVNGLNVELTNEYFEERMYDLLDTSGGEPRRKSQRISNSQYLPRDQHQQQSNQQQRVLTKGMIDSVLNNIPKYFDDSPIVRVKGNKKRKRSSHVGWNPGLDSRDPSPLPPQMMMNQGMMPSSLPQGMKPPPTAVITSVIPTPKEVVVAGHDSGIPAPNFLQPLASRETHHISSKQDETVPSMPSYVNGRSTVHPTKFRHRPRLGRGGRIIIDRVPFQSSSSISNCDPPTVITYGTPMNRSGYNATTLGADGPNYSINSSPNKLCNPNNSERRGTNAKTGLKVPPAQQLSDLLPKPVDNTNNVLSRKIEEICAMGLLEDYQSNQKSKSAVTSSAVSSSVSSTKNGNATSSAAAATAYGGEDVHEVLVPIEDWMEAPESLKIYGSEKFVIGL